MAQVTVEQLETAKSISGPFILFEGSFSIEFLEPPSFLNASVLAKAVYVASHPLCKKGKAHPQSPPLHLHFDQSETFLVASGKVGTTSTWKTLDQAWTRENTPHEIEPWTPHSFWPHPEAEEDTVMYVWAHPEKVEEPMDWLFFQTLLRFVGDCHDGKEKMDVVQIMVTQHASATAMIMLPKASFLGPLRWWIPWKFQAGIAAIGRLRGYRALMEKYTPKEHWETYLHAKRA